MDTDTELTEDWKMGMLDALTFNDPHNRDFPNLSRDYWQGYTKGEAIRESEQAREFFQRYADGKVWNE
jgi:hypothetical protein